MIKEFVWILAYQEQTAKQDSVLMLIRVQQDNVQQVPLLLIYKEFVWNLAQVTPSKIQPETV